MVLLLALCGQLALADSLFAHGHYEAARIEYERAFFFHPELRQEVEPRLNHAVARLAVDETAGVAALSAVINDIPALPAAATREIARQYLRCGRYYLAIGLLRDTDEWRLLGLAYLLDGQPMRARDVFLENGARDMAAGIDDFLRRPGRSETTALLLSLILPGAGQAYAGEVRAGLAALAINLGSGYLLGNALRQQKYVDAGLVFFFLINRFYLGALGNAQQAAREYNTRQWQTWQQTFIDAYFEGLKP